MYGHIVSRVFLDDKAQSVTHTPNIYLILIFLILE